MTETPDTPADLQFTSKDFDGLVNTLSGIAKDLSKGQWGLLLSIFAAAAGHLEVSPSKTKGKFSGVRVKDGTVIEDPKDINVEVLREQLRKAYLPGKPPSSIGSMVSPPKTPTPPPPKK